MGWERRKRGGWYYCRTLRRDGRQVRQYLGGESSPAALLAWAADVEAREARRRDADALRAVRDRMNAPDALAGRLDRQVGLVLEAALLARGCHRPGRHAWRRRRTDGRG